MSSGRQWQKCNLKFYLRFVHIRTILDNNQKGNSNLLNDERASNLLSWLRTGDGNDSSKRLHCTDLMVNTRLITKIIQDAIAVELSMP